jgi:6-phosphogluconolactonase/glucosamine-6-phosphate isomerase/deaminase
MNKFSAYGHEDLLLLLSGGSSLSLLDLIPDTLLRPTTTITTLDERHARDPEKSNFVQLQRSDFYRKALDKRCVIYDSSQREGETLQQHASRLNAYLKSWHQKYKGVVIATQGVGEDAHTAGIFPDEDDPKRFTKRFMTPDTYVVGYESPNATVHRKRITTSIWYLQHQVDHSIIMIVGEKKRKAYDIATGKTLPQMHEAPAAVIPLMRDVTVITNL